MRFISASLLALAAMSCKGDDPPRAAAGAGGSAAPSKPAAEPGKVAEIAARPRVTVTIDPLGLAIVVPEGTAVDEPRPDARDRYAHLETSDRAFMVNINAIDQYSVPSFDKAIEVHEADKLVEWYRKEQTADGWITFKQVISSVHKGPRFEIDVRRTVAGRPWDCSVSSADRTAAELALEACQTLTAARP